jgi:hypothetical protein
MENWGNSRHSMRIRKHNHLCRWIRWDGSGQNRRYRSKEVDTAAAQVQTHNLDAENSCMAFWKGTWWLGSGLNQDIVALVLATAG